MKHRSRQVGIDGKTRNKEGLKVARLLMVLSSLSPLFILWGIRGNPLISDKYFITFCVLMVIVPYTVLGLRIRTAKKQNDKRELVMGRVEDNRNHLLVYLFAMLLPLYATEIGTWREFSAVIVALGFIVFIFWHLNLHYINIVFAILNYHIYTVYSPEEGYPTGSRENFILITPRTSLSKHASIVATRISNTVYIEVNE
ncbi:MAG: hypothetical protein ACTSPV_18910 [Candidatus Hodarchaeales archaeon]